MWSAQCRDPEAEGRCGGCEPPLGRSDRCGGHGGRDHGDAARSPPCPRGKLLRGRRPRSRSLRRPRDRLRRAPRLCRLPGVRELRHLAKRRRDGGAGRQRAVRDGPALPRRRACAPFRRARLLRAYGRPQRVAEDADGHARRHGQSLDVRDVPHHQDREPTLGRRAGGLREMARPAHRPRGCAGGPTHGAEG